MEGSLAESPHSVSHPSSHSEIQLLNEFPSVLVLLASDDQVGNLSIISAPSRYKL